MGWNRFRTHFVAVYRHPVADLNPKGRGIRVLIRELPDTPEGSLLGCAVTTLSPPTSSRGDPFCTTMEHDYLELTERLERAYSPRIALRRVSLSDD